MLRTPSLVALPSPAPAAAALVLVLAAAAPIAAQHPNHPLGLSPERAYEQAPIGIDTVDLFSGTLTATIPIGPFSLTYSSNVWRYAVVLEDDVPQVRVEPDRQDNSGLGWRLTWGEVYGPDHWYNDSGRWLYVAPDGGRHIFYDQLHRFENDGDPNVFYSRDNSYLRLVVGPGANWTEIEAPDGSTSRFVKSTTSGGVHRLTAQWSPFKSLSDPDVTVAYNADDTERTVTDRYGRVHRIFLDDELGGVPVSWLTRVITRVDIQGFNGQRTFYDFTYANIHVDVSCKDTSSQTPSRIRVPHLVQIDFPDGTAYTFQEGATPLYNNTCQSGIEDLPGTLSGVNLPTGGKVRWDYQEYEFPPGEGNSPFNTTAGISARRVLEKDGSPFGSWLYKSTGIGATENDDPEMHTEVVSPTGDCSKHFFNARYWQTPSQGRGWEYGLPFVYTEQQAGRYLSTELWTSQTNGSCSGTKLRSSYVRYRRDQTPGTTDVPIADWYATNRVPEALRTLYHDDGGRYTDLELSEFDGLGNFRREVATGDFWSGSANHERRETYTAFDRSTGIYPGTYVPVMPSEPWILGVHSSVEVSEPDAVGESVSRIEIGYEGATGFMHCTRTLASGSQRSARDQLVTYARNGLGQVTDIKAYGADRQTLPTGGAGCGWLPAEPAYWTRYEYQAGSRVRQKGRTPQGVDAPFWDVDVDVDPSTGLMVTRRDSTGYEIHFGYDEMNRMISATPQDGGVNQYTYDNATASSPMKTSTMIHAPSDGSVLAHREIVYDDFGRPEIERRKLPNAGWTERETVRNARGWATSVSEWGDLSRKTQYLGIDSFGRPARVRPPDGATHDVVLSYAGDRAVTRTVKVAQAGGEAYTSTVRYRDRYGRLRQTEEPTGPGGTSTPTIYRYDVNGRLTWMLSGVSGGPQQARSMTYDNRGFLLSETLPEAGYDGNGTIGYLDYDAAGHPHRRVSDGRDLAFEYDYLGRLTAVRDKLQNDRLEIAQAWDGAPGRGLGKLWYSDRWNYRYGGSTAVDTVRVRQQYAYHGDAGSISRQDTRIYWDFPNLTFKQFFSYNETGQPAAYTYPACTKTICTASASSGQTVSYGYQDGRMTSVSGYAHDIQYHASGRWKSVHHTNNVVSRQDMDPSFTDRPSRLFTTGVQGSGQNFDSGLLAYDGAGNVKAVGGNSYVYDAASRLVQADQWGISEQYGYDRFNNMTQRSGGLLGGMVNIPVDPLTNRLTSAAYDGSGNMVTWGSGAPNAYDTMDRLVNQGWMRYAYDASGERIVAIPDTGNLQPVAHLTLRDPAHRLVSKLTYADGVIERERDYVYGAGRLLASSGNVTSGTNHFHLDHLGTPRLITDVNGAPVVSQNLMPYGEEFPTRTLYENLKLTGHERDFSTDADYMHSRHYLAPLGRFHSVDSFAGFSSSPKTLNRYAYALGNPMTFADPDGRCGWWCRLRNFFNRPTDPAYYGGSGTITVTGKLPRLPYIPPIRLPGGWVNEGGGGGDITPTHDLPGELPPGPGVGMIGPDGNPVPPTGAGPESPTADEPHAEHDVPFYYPLGPLAFIVILDHYHMAYYRTIYEYLIIPPLFWATAVGSGLVVALIADPIFLFYRAIFPPLATAAEERGLGGWHPILDRYEEAWPKMHRGWRRYLEQRSLRKIWTLH